jgi:hypothetical protein
MNCGLWWANEAFHPSPSVTVYGGRVDGYWLHMRWKPPAPEWTVEQVAAHWGLDAAHVQEAIARGRIVLKSNFPCGKPHVVAFPSETQSYCPRCR